MWFYIVSLFRLNCFCNKLWKAYKFWFWFWFWKAYKLFETCLVRVMLFSFKISFIYMFIQSVFRTERRTLHRVARLALHTVVAFTFACSWMVHYCNVEQSAFMYVNLLAKSYCLIFFNLPILDLFLIPVFCAHLRLVSWHFL
jgi:hypothetical protein